MLITDKLIYKDMFEKPKTKRIFALMLTWQCNLNCVYCFEKYKTKNKEMSLETAKNIILKEFGEFEKTGDDGIIKVDFFGGEPLLNFPVIRDLSEWIWQQKFSINYVLSVTTNGTLLNEEMKSWFRLHKEHFRLILSVDGTEEMQRINRGCKEENLPIEFVRDTWPELYLKSTMSKESLKTFADGVIYMLDKGYRVSSSIAIGVPWDDGDAQIYKRELEKIADYYLQHMEIEPMPLFTRVFAELMEPYCNQTPVKNCGTGTTMLAYDVDGTPYPCHLFLPIVHGKNRKDEISKIDFFDNDRMIDDDCRKCGMLRICRTCYGFNYNDRGDVNKRDKRVCSMLLVEAQVLSAFQINYLVKMARMRKLTDSETFALKAAIKCHHLYKDFILK